MAATFDTGDVELLLDLYHSAGSDGEPRRPPWTWAALKPYERNALLRMCAEFVESYNRIHAVKEDELIPPCWVLHHELAAELAVQVWLYYFAHLDTKATPAVAGDYYGRHLPGFRSRVNRMLGRSPGECRRGEHQNTWRTPADDRLAEYSHLVTDESRQETAVNLLGKVHFGFPHANHP